MIDINCIDLDDLEVGEVITTSKFTGQRCAICNAPTYCIRKAHVLLNGGKKTLDFNRSYKIWYPCRHSPPVFAKD